MNIIDTEIPTSWLATATLTWVTSVANEPSDGGKRWPVPRQTRPRQRWTFDVWNEDVVAVEDLFNLCNGAANGFFARPPVDRYYIATAQAIGTGTGSSQELQLAVTRGLPIDILYPVTTGITIYANGVALTEGVHWSLGALGMVTVTATNGHALTWSGQYKTPFQFIEDLEIEAEATFEMPVSVSILEIL